MINDENAEMKKMMKHMEQKHGQVLNELLTLKDMMSESNENTHTKLDEKEKNLMEEMKKERVSAINRIVLNDESSTPRIRKTPRGRLQNQTFADALKNSMEEDVPVIILKSKNIEIDYNKTKHMIQQKINDAENLIKHATKSKNGGVIIQCLSLETLNAF